MGKQRKARRRSLRPPLSLLDKSIYWAGVLSVTRFRGCIVYLYSPTFGHHCFPRSFCYRLQKPWHPFVYNTVFIIPWVKSVHFYSLLLGEPEAHLRQPENPLRRDAEGKRLLSYIRSETETCPYLTVPKSPSPPDSAVMADRSAFCFSDRFFRSFRPCLSNAGAPYHKL